MQEPELKVLRKGFARILTVDDCFTAATDPVLPGWTAAWLYFKVGLSQHRAGLALHPDFLSGIMGHDWLCFSNWQDLWFHYAGDLFHQLVCGVVWAYTVNFAWNTADRLLLLLRNSGCFLFFKPKKKLDRSIFLKYFELFLYGINKTLDIIPSPIDNTNSIEFFW